MDWVLTLPHDKPAAVLVATLIAAAAALSLLERARRRADLRIGPQR